MTSFYDYISDEKVANIEALESFAQQLKTNKSLLVTGVFASEPYNGDEFCWLGSCLQIFSMQPDFQDVYLAVRTDLLSLEEIQSRFKRDDDSLEFEVIERFSNDIAEYTVFKSNKPIKSYANISLKAVKEESGTQRELSIPLARVLLVPHERDLTKQELFFAVRTGLADAKCNVFPSTGYSDKVADYFRAVSMEMIHGA